jgi:hypothetical protein
MFDPDYVRRCLSRVAEGAVRQETLPLGGSLSA